MRSGIFLWRKGMGHKIKEISVRRKSKRETIVLWHEVVHWLMIWCVCYTNKWRLHYAWIEERTRVFELLPSQNYRKLYFFDAIDFWCYSSSYVICLGFPMHLHHLTLFRQKTYWYWWRDLATAITWTNNFVAHSSTDHSLTAFEFFASVNPIQLLWIQFHIISHFYHFPFVRSYTRVMRYLMNVVWGG